MACDDVSKHWANFLRQARICYDLLSDLAPEVRSVVGHLVLGVSKFECESTPAQGLLMTITIGVMIRQFSRNFAVANRPDV